MEKRVDIQQEASLKGQSSFHHERPPSPVPTCVSVKSDLSMEPPITFKHDDVTDGSSSFHHERPPSPVPTCVSMKSDESMEPPITFKHGDVTDGSSSSDHERPPSPVPTCQSMKSDRSMDPPITFKHDVTDGSSSVHHERSPSPVPTCQSMKSDWSMDPHITFKHDVTDGSSGQMEECNLDAFSDQFTQRDLKRIFQLLEEKIITFVKNELRRFKKILSPDYQENFEGKEQDDIDAREGALKMALHFLRNMKQKTIVDKLQENEQDILCQTELKRNLKKKYQSVFEGIPKQGSSALLEKIYTEVYITEGGSGKVNEEHEVRQIESIFKRPAGQETPIKCREIFKPLPGQDKPIRSVITKGVAGIGKTVSVQKFILDWAERKENQDVHFIFPLPFRELNSMKEKQLSLMDLLHHFFSEIKQLTFPSQGKYKVLFIFDGLDECRLRLDFQKNEILTEVTMVTSLDVLLTNLIKGNLLPSALLWITSRPAAAHQIPPQNVDRVTEVQGFNDPQKEEYFRRKICDQNLANKVFSHIKSSRSLYIMCHIPVFCWIAATVLEFLLKTEGGKQVPKTLTEMYTYFLVFQTKQRSLKFEGVYDKDPQWNRASLLAVGKLAYEQLVKGNLIFYEDDLRESGIDVREAAVHCGICTQIFQEESGLHQEKLYCFVHLSIQEYLAALYVLLTLITERIDLMSPKKAKTVIQLLKWQSMQKSMTTLQKSAVDKALEHEDGRFDLFLRFLLGLSLESNQRLLRGLIKKVTDQDKKEIASYIKTNIREYQSSERVINLFHCLNEVNDHSLVEEVQSFLSAGTLSEAKLSSTQLSALVFVLLTSEEKLDVFDLKKYIRSDECLLRLQPVVEESQKALLNSCGLTERSCAGLASVLTKASSKLKHLDLSANSIGDTGVQHLCSGLGDPNCILETLGLSDCSITEKGYGSLASALRLNLKSLRELDLRGNDPGESGVKLLLDLKEDPQCTLTNVQFLKSSAAEEACAAVASAVGSNPLLMTELDLSGRIPGVLGVTQLCTLLQDPHCTLQTLRLSDCNITEKGYASLASALKLNPNHLRELDLRGNDPGESGVKLLLDRKEDPRCTLSNVQFLKSSAAEEACAAVASAVGSNPLLMTELDLSGRIPGVLGVTMLCALLQDPLCTLHTLRLLNCSIGEEGFRALASALRSNPSRMRELQLSGNKAGDSGVKYLFSLLEDPNCKLENLHLKNCSFGEEGFRALASALRSNPSHMKELQLSGNKAGGSGVKHLSSLLEDPNCKLEKLILWNCSIGEEGLRDLASALRSNPSHMRELDLGGNKAGDSGVKHLSSLLEDPNCKLEKLVLSDCSITEKGYASLASALRLNPNNLKELDLRGNDPGESGVKLLLDLKEDPQCTLTNVQFLKSSAAVEACAAVASAVGSNPLLMTELDLSGRIPGVLGVTQLCALLQDPLCTLQTLRLQNCSFGEEGFRTLASALRSNPSHMRQLQLSGNKAGESGVKHLSSLLEDPNCKLYKLDLQNCSIGEEGFRALASALRSNPSHMRWLKLGENKAGESGVKHLSSLLEDPNCKLYKLDLQNCSIGEEGFRALASALRSNPSHMRLLSLSENKAGDSGVKHLSPLLEDPNCKLETLNLWNCSIGEEGFRALASALRSNPSHMRQLWLSGNEAGDSGVKHLSSLLEDPNCKLETLDLDNCSIGQEGFKALASALRSNPSHMRELGLGWNDAGDSGVKHLSSLLEDPNCKLETLGLQYCSITDEGFRALASALRSNPSALRELNLKEYQPRPSAQQLLSELQKDPNCKHIQIHGP
ncbi:uncharacterized protein LOC143127181 isoform X8 [Alosa pseudoharengus]|uniref:uncharacterized protein LOC143127181 isoform X8 n=3 Tax=Alosa pseudoharengus TaxID=34774 RepID=UPI003F88AC29